jgi:hypothetical protein
MVNSKRFTNDGLRDALPVDDNFQTFPNNVSGQAINSLPDIGSKAYFDEWKSRNDRLLSPIVEFESAGFDPQNCADGYVYAFCRMQQRERDPVGWDSVDRKSIDNPEFLSKCC